MCPQSGHATKGLDDIRPRQRFEASGHAPVPSGPALLNTNKDTAASPGRNGSIPSREWLSGFAPASQPKEGLVGSLSFERPALDLSTAKQGLLGHRGRRRRGGSLAPAWPGRRFTCRQNLMSRQAGAASPPAASAAGTAMAWSTSWSSIRASCAAGGVGAAAICSRFRAAAEQWR